MSRGPHALSAKGLLFYLLLPVGLFLVPTSWLEGKPSLCLSRLLFGVRCPGCGMVRATSSVVHGHFKQAWHYNPLIVVVFPLLCYVWLRSVTRELKNALLPAFLQS